nr:hypothetical protein [Tanacetum cinerariifolium]
MINAQVDDLSSHNTKYTSPAFTQKVFANIRRIGKGFSGVETPLFDTMLVQPQVHDAAKVDAEDEDDNEVSATPTSLPPPQEHIPSPPQAQPAPPSSPPPQQPTQLADTSESPMTFLIAQALKIVKVKQRVKKLENKRRSKSLRLKRLRKGGEITELDADEDVTIVDVDTAVEMDADTQGRLEEDVTAVNEINAVESKPTMKVEKARILDEQMAKRLKDKEIKQVVAMERQEKEDLERTKVLQQQYDQKQENIDWNIVEEQMQEEHLDNIKKYQSLKWKPISVAQARKNMIVYLKNVARYKI